MKKNKFTFKALVLPMGLLLLGLAGVGAPAETLHIEDLTQSNAAYTDSKITTLIATLKDLQGLTLTSSQSGLKDDLEVDAIPATNWWSYFRDRADRFELNPEKCTFGAIAYVDSNFPKLIHICELFYSQSRIDRIQVLLHEVRHFDGFDHTICMRGSSLGVRGGCDHSIQEKGAYSVTLQASVAIALRGEKFSEAERAFARASALYTATNRFNEEAQIRLKETLYLEDEKGVVYEVDPKTPKYQRRITQLQSPARLYTTGSEVTVYPTDPKEDAYRLTEDFFLKSENIGSFATFYNSSSTEVRGRISSFNYVGRGGYVVNGSIRLHCPEGMLGSYEGLPEQISNVISLKNKTYFLGLSGKLYFGWCAPSERVYFDPVTMTAPPRLQRVVEIGDQIYALNEGQVFRSELKDGHLILTEPLQMQGPTRWIEMAKRSVPVLFEPATSYGKPESY